jgi:sirohydrochlorin cobaltochelatase
MERNQSLSGYSNRPYNESMEKWAILVYAHGARDPRWAEPFARLLARIREKQPSLPAALAFLDYLEPNVINAAQELVRQGATRIRIVPMFFGRGGHLREDFPAQLSALRAAISGVEFEIAEAAGESDDVIEALAGYALSGIDSRG